MFLNNSFPMNYQPYYMQQSQSQPVGTGITWVQGEAGAKSYLVAPNSTVALWDSENQIIYLKSADASGMPTMKVLDYTIRGGQALNQNVEYATKDDLEKLRAEIKESLKGADE